MTGRDKDPALEHIIVPPTTDHVTLLKKIYEYQLQQKLDTSTAFDFSKEALQQGNLKAIEILAEAYIRYNEKQNAGYDTPDSALGEIPHHFRISFISDMHPDKNESPRERHDADKAGH